MKINTTIKAIGVGNGAKHIIDRLTKHNPNSIDLIIADTHIETINSSKAPISILLGTDVTKGEGTCLNPLLGQLSAIQSYDKIKDILVGADIVFVYAGLGGGTGSGATPIIAQAAREIGALCISIITIPFRFEGTKRYTNAMHSLLDIKQNSDSTIIIDNDKLVSKRYKDIKKYFKKVDKVLVQIPNTIIESITPNYKAISLDFADLKTVITNKSLLFWATEKYHGKHSAYNAIKNAINSPIFEDISINNAMAIVVYFDIHPDHPIMDISNAMSIIEDNAKEDTSIIFATSNNTKLKKNEIKVTIIASQFTHQIDILTKKFSAFIDSNKPSKDNIKLDFPPFFN